MTCLIVDPRKTSWVLYPVLSQATDRSYWMASLQSLLPASISVDSSSSTWVILRMKHPDTDTGELRRIATEQDWKWWGRVPYRNQWIYAWNSWNRLRQWCITHHVPSPEHQAWVLDTEWGRVHVQDHKIRLMEPDTPLPDWHLWTPPPRYLQWPEELSQLLGRYWSYQEAGWDEPAYLIWGWWAMGLVIETVLQMWDPLPPNSHAESTKHRLQNLAQDAPVLTQACQHWQQWWTLRNHVIHWESRLNPNPFDKVVAPPHIQDLVAILWYSGWGWSWPGLDVDDSWLPPKTHPWGEMIRWQIFQSHTVPEDSASPT